MGDLSSVKAGDECVIVRSGVMGEEYKVVTVDKVTPSGIVVTGDNRWNSNGSHRGDTSGMWIASRTLEPMSDEIIHTMKALRAKNKKKALAQEIAATNFHELPDDALSRIYSILQEKADE